MPGIHLIPTPSPEEFKYTRDEVMEIVGVKTGHDGINA